MSEKIQPEIESRFQKIEEKLDRNYQLMLGWVKSKLPEDLISREKKELK